LRCLGKYASIAEENLERLMSTLIERRYLLASNSNEWKYLGHDVTRLKQGYLYIGDHHSVYIRMQDADVASLCYRQEKIGIPDTCYKLRIPHYCATVLFGMCRGRVIRRSRYLVDHKGHLFRINEFKDSLSGLVLIEAELKNMDEAVELPAWVGTEVTTNPAYTLSHLARHGLSVTNLGARRAVP
jgi:adenylate cyclase